jgi:hypothetical protein
MICSESIDSTPQTAPKTFINWARALTFTAATSYRPTKRGEIVKIIQQAEVAGQRVKWTGSLWSFMGVYVSNDVVVESDAITGVIDRALILGQLRPLADESLRASLVHIKGGTKVFDVNRLLHGMRPLGSGGRGDEFNLDCFSASRALPTLGGSGGQSIAGVMATGSHGGDVHLPPIADCVQAIHLIGPAGQEFWIERSSGLTAGTEAHTQGQLQRIVDSDPIAAEQMCNGILVRKSDDLFRAALVSVGRMGFVYSLVIKTVPAFKLKETGRDDTWETVRTNLGAETFPHFTEGTDGADRYFLNVLINPFGNSGTHSCKVTERKKMECGTMNVGMDHPAGGDIMALFCQRQDVRVFLPLLLAVLVGLTVAVGALVALSAVEFATADVLAAIPFIGWILAAAMYAAWAVTLAAIAVLSTTIAALTGLITYLTVTGSLTAGDLVAAIANFAYAFGLKDLIKTVLTLLYNSAYSLVPRTGVSWKIMDTYGYSGDDFCKKVDSMEIAFDVAAATGGGGYLAFIDEVLATFDDLFNRNIAVAGILTLRYTSNTEALIGMSKFATTCHIEIPILKNFAGNAEFISRVQAAAIAHDGVPHWGQGMSGYTGADISRLHGADLRTWRLALSRLIHDGGEHRFTFSNDFTMTYNLEPFDDTPISAVRLTITVGDDSLGDTDFFRRDVSADDARVTLASGAVFGISLNEGTEWRAGTTHVRDVLIDPPAMWGDVRSVSIEHHAAGDDTNADNWKMNSIVISSVSTAGDVLDQFSRSDTPVWQFRKNDHQIWQHDFI